MRTSPVMTELRRGGTVTKQTKYASIPRLWLVSGRQLRPILACDWSRLRHRVRRRLPVSLIWHKPGLSSYVVVASIMIPFNFHLSLFIFLVLECIFEIFFARDLFLQMLGHIYLFLRRHWLWWRLKDWIKYFFVQIFFVVQIFFITRPPHVRLKLDFTACSRAKIETWMFFPRKDFEARWCQLVNRRHSLGKNKCKNCSPATSY